MFYENAYSMIALCFRSTSVSLKRDFVKRMTAFKEKLMHQRFIIELKLCRQAVETLSAESNGQSVLITEVYDLESEFGRNIFKELV